MAPAPSEDPDEAKLLGIGSTRAPGAASAAPVPEVLGLHPGDTLGPITITTILPLAEGRQPVLVHHKQGDVLLEIALLGAGPPPPATTKQFAIYWRRDPTRPVPDATFDEATQALAKRLAATEDKLVPPEGMRAYGKETPRKK